MCNYCFPTAKVVKFVHNYYYSLTISQPRWIFMSYIYIVFIDIECFFVIFSVKNITKYMNYPIFSYLCNRN